MTDSYRKKPVVIKAWRCAHLTDWAADDWYKLPPEVIAAYDKGGWVFMRDGIYIPTLEGSMKAERSDMIIMGVAGEFYPCKSHIFEATYDVVEEEEADPIMEPAMQAAGSQNKAFGYGGEQWVVIRFDEHRIQRKQRNELRAENDELRTQIEALKDEATSQRQRALDAERDNEVGIALQTQDNSEYWKSQYLARLNTVQAQAREISDLTNKLNGVQTHNKGLSTANEELRKDVDGLLRDNRNLTVENDALRKFRQVLGGGSTPAPVVDNVRVYAIETRLDVLEKRIASVDARTTGNIKLGGTAL